MDLIWPAIVWNEGRCWAYLHDMAPDALNMVVSELRNAETDRSLPHRNVTAHGC